VLTTSPSRRWNIETILLSLDRVRLVVVRPCSSPKDHKNSSGDEIANVLVNDDIAHT